MMGRFGGGLAALTASWRIALRIAFRAARRSMGRSVLVVCLLSIPICAASVLVMAYSWLAVGAEQKATWQLGQADLHLSGPDLEEVTSALPPGSQVALDRAGDTVVATPTGFVVSAYRAVDVSSPLLDGAHLIRAGRLPVGASEVALTGPSAESLDLGLGDTLSAGMPLRELTVVGIIDTPGQLSRELLIVPAEHPLSTGGREGVLVGLPDSHANWVPMKDGPAVNIGFTRRDGLGASAAERALAAAGAAVVVGFASVQVLLLVAAAFAVGARRQQRDLALIAAAGATGRQLARMVLANGLLLGTAAGVVGVGLGVVISLAGRGVLERLADHPVPSVTFGSLPWWQLAGAGGLAVMIGLGAAFGPARGVARQQLRQAMSGREVAATRTTRRLKTIGLGMAAIGVMVAVFATRPAVGSAVLAAVGGGFVLVGAAACAPGAVAVAGILSSRTTLPVRLAVRHGARHRLRTGAAAAAVCAAMAGSVGMILYMSADTNTGVAAAPTAPAELLLLPPTGAELLSPDDLDRLAQLPPVTKVVPLRIADAHVAQPAGPPDVAPPQVSTAVGVGGADVVQAITGAEPDPAAMEALDRGGAITFYQHLSPNGGVRLLTTDGSSVELPSTMVPAAANYSDTSTLPGIVISAETARALQLEVGPGGVLVRTGRVPTPEEFIQAQSIVLGAQVRDPENVPAGPAPLVAGAEATESRVFTPITLILALVSALVTLVASGVAVSLANAEMRDDLSTLAAVGAGPGLNRAVAAGQAGLIVGIGGILGMLSGVTPAAGLIAINPEVSWHPPWGALGLAIVGSPALAVMMTALLARQRTVLVRRLT